MRISATTSLDQPQMRCARSTGAGESGAAVTRAIAKCGCHPAWSVLGTHGRRGQQWRPLSGMTVSLAHHPRGRSSQMDGPPFFVSDGRDIISMFGRHANARQCKFGSSRNSGCPRVEPMRRAARSDTSRDIVTDVPGRPAQLYGVSLQPLEHPLGSDYSSARSRTRSATLRGQRLGQNPRKPIRQNFRNRHLPLEALMR